MSHTNPLAATIEAATSGVPFSFLDQHPVVIEEITLTDLSYIAENALNFPEFEDEYHEEYEDADWTEEAERGWAQQDRIDTFRREY
jgi:hypothetical protein